MIKVKLFANFREAAGKKDVELEFKGKTVKDAIDTLVSKYPALEPLMLKDGEIKPYVNIILNGKNAVDDGYLKLKVKDGDELAIFPPVSGG
jgi:sulfur-carrier protein